MECKCEANRYWAGRDEWEYLFIVVCNMPGWQIIVEDFNRQRTKAVTQTDKNLNRLFINPWITAAAQIFVYPDVLRIFL